MITFFNYIKIGIVSSFLSISLNAAEQSSAITLPVPTAQLNSVFEVPERCISLIRFLLEQQPLVHRAENTLYRMLSTTNDEAHLCALLTEAAAVKHKPHISAFGNENNQQHTQDGILISYGIKQYIPHSDPEQLYDLTALLSAYHTVIKEITTRWRSMPYDRGPHIYCSKNKKMSNERDLLRHLINIFNLQEYIKLHEDHSSSASENGIGCWVQRNHFQQVKEKLGFRFIAFMTYEERQRLLSQATTTNTASAIVRY